MTKKLIMFITATVIAAAMLLLPVSAARPDNLTNAMATSVDYRTESPEDLTGNLSFTQDPEDIEYVEFDGITCVDRTCIFNSNEGFRMQYQGDRYQTLNEVFTIETYVYMTDTVYGVPLEIWWGGDDNFACLGWDGYRFGFGQDDFASDKSVMEEEDRDLTDGWYHLVVTSDGTTDNLYVNGELVGSGTGPEGGMPGLWYYYNLKTDTEGYAMAYLTIYNVAATADEVTALYESVDEEIVAPSNPSSPSPSASADPSEDPSEEPSTGNDSTTPPSSDNDNPSTFDAGILSLGVMALSSCLAMRKRR